MGDCREADERSGGPVSPSGSDVPSGTATRPNFGGFRHTRHPYFYGDFLDTSRYAGGSEAFSHWLSRADVLGALRHAGLGEIVVGEEDVQHVNGPSISLVAHRPGPEAARFRRHLDAVDEIRAIVTAGGPSVPQVCVGVAMPGAIPFAFGPQPQ